MFALRSPPFFFLLSFRFFHLDFLKQVVQPLRTVPLKIRPNGGVEGSQRKRPARVSFLLSSIGMWVCPPLVKIHPRTHKPIHYQYTAGAEFKCYEPQEGVDLITRESINPTREGFLSICITSDLLLPLWAVLQSPVDSLVSGERLGRGFQGSSSLSTQPRHVQTVLQSESRDSAFSLCGRRANRCVLLEMLTSIW